MRKRAYFFVVRMFFGTFCGTALLLSACSPAAMSAPALTLAPTAAPTTATPAPTPAPEASVPPTPAAAEQNVCVMPDLVWETADFAMELIAACNPEIAVEYEARSDVPSGLVAAQSLPEGRQIQAGNRVILTVSVPASTPEPDGRSDRETEEQQAAPALPAPEPTPYVTALGLVQNPDGTFSDPTFFQSSSNDGPPQSCG